MSIAYYDEKYDTVYIRSKSILPDTSGMKFKDHCRAYTAAFKLSYDERLDKYATEDEASYVRNLINEHPGCKVSEYDNL